MDDFGTGYSSLAYLSRLPVTKLKIDRSFLAQVGEEASATALFEAIVRLGHTLGLDVVAEGVETEAQWHYLRALGGDAAQGFWLSRPLPPEELEVLLLHWAEMNSRTNSVCGFALISAGLPTCSMRPIDMTTTRSASSIASS